ncbi:MAG: cytochrome [Microbacterium sp. SCN 70-18]|nr:MAG: cytochrome [Microbacterium sp. SCN 70-18]
MSENAAAFNPFTGPYQADPATSLSWARESEPVFFSPEINYWVVTRYDDCKQVFREFKNFSAVNTLYPFKEPTAEIAGILGDYGFVDMPGLSSMDPPAHREARKVNSVPFLPENIGYLEPRIREIITRYIDQILEKDQADLVADVFWDVPAIVALIFMGIPDEDIDEVRHLALSMTTFTWGRPEEQEAVEAAHGMGRFWEMAGRVLRKLQAMENPQGWMGHVIKETRERPELYTQTDLQGLLMGGVLAAHETTTNASLNAIRALLENRDQWEKICHDPTLIPGAVEESLRYAGSVVAWRRRAWRDIEVGGVTIPEGGDILMVMASANRDPRHFPDPDRFDIERENARDHLTFGFGTHTCLGNNIARMEMRIFLEEFTSRIPGLRLQEQEYTFLANTSFRGPEQLLVTWDTRSRQLA